MRFSSPRRLRPPPNSEIAKTRHHRRRPGEFRAQLQTDLGNDDQRSEQAGVQLLKVVARDILHNAAACLGEAAIDSTTFIPIIQSRIVPAARYGPCAFAAAMPPTVAPAHSRDQAAKTDCFPVKRPGVGRESLRLRRESSDRPEHIRLSAKATSDQPRSPRAAEDCRTRSACRRRLEESLLFRPSEVRPVLRWTADEQSFAGEIPSIVNAEPFQGNPTRSPRLALKFRRCWLWSACRFLCRPRWVGNILAGFRRPIRIEDALHAEHGLRDPHRCRRGP